MNLKKDTAIIQEQLGEYCRTGVETDIPGVTPGRIHHYRRLVNNVVRDILDSGFPIALATLGEEQWDKMVQDFFINGKPKAPQVWRLPFEFYQYHAALETGTRIGKPYLDDLLYFEWMETEVYNMTDRPFPEFVKEGKVLEDRLAFNPEYEIIRMEYPVHMHPAEKTPEIKGVYFVLIFRAPDTGYVQFLNLSSLNAYILTRLVEEDLPVGHLRGDIAQSTGIESGTYLDAALEKFVEELMRKQLILGYKKE
jgi:hypothetical protein